MLEKKTFYFLRDFVKKKFLSKKNSHVQISKWFTKYNDGMIGCMGPQQRSGRWYCLQMHARNHITMPCGIVEGHPAAHLGLAMWAILDHSQHA